MGCTVSIKMKKENLKEEGKAVILNSGSCIIKMSPEGKWNVHYFKPLHAQKNIEIIKHCFVVDIITQHHLGYLVTKSTPDIECYGIYALNMQENRIIKILIPYYCICNRWQWTGIPHHNQSCHCYRRWYRHGVSGKGKN